MSLISQSTIAPIPYEPALAQEVLNLFPELRSNISALLFGVAGSSPYLRNLLKTETEWIVSTLDASPQDVLADIHAGLSPESKSLAKDLRKAKRRIALYTALADCGGMWDLAEVTQALTDFADLAVQSSLRHFMRADFERGRLPGCTEQDLETDCGMVVLAMGKMGAGELNYSSDIDLIVLFDESRHSDESFEDIRQRFIRITKQMSRMLSDVTSGGYVFRTDLRLRPDPSVTPVCLSMAAAERYYESLGRTWERAAYIKARPCAGDIKAGLGFLQTLRPFIWRKHLDYAAIEDAHDMRLAIREHKGLGGPLRLAGHNMKLGRGGIREIEFFTQTRQIIAGGRDPDLRQRETVKGLAALVGKGWVDPAAAKDLAQAYQEHRRIEHRIQMLNDAQTHDIPRTTDQIMRLANFSGFATIEGFENDVVSRLTHVHELIEKFFNPDAKSQVLTVELTPEMKNMVDKWHAYPALRSNRANEIFNRLQPVILGQIIATPVPLETLTQFDGFLAGLPAGVQLFSLFEANPQLIDLLVEICGSAPGLARYLSHNSAVFDAVIGGTFFSPLPDMDVLTAALDFHLAGGRDYEDQLNAARRWMKELHFKIGVQHLKGNIDALEAGRHYSDLAQAVLRALLPPVCAEFARRHGPMPGRGIMVLGMGSLGAQSLTATSDLDLIVIYDAQGQEISEGKRPLAVTTYFARLTQALVNALSAPMAQGRLYEVDMRLRPSGRKGPVATALSAFTGYQTNEAWTWEHLALTRARPVGGDPSLCLEIETFRQKIITQSRDQQQALSDMRDMQKRLNDAADKSRDLDVWETKSGAGRMLDIELIAQMAALLAGEVKQDVAAQLKAGLRSGWILPDEFALLTRTYENLRRVQQVVRLLLVGAFQADKLGPDGRKMLLRETHQASISDLAAALAQDKLATSTLIPQLSSRAAPCRAAP